MCCQKSYVSDSAQGGGVNNGPRGGQLLSGTRVHKQRSSGVAASRTSATLRIISG